MKITVRSERPEDYKLIRQINVAAFGAESEANLVEALRNSNISLISLVAEDHGRLLGHILFSSVRLEGLGPDISIAGLAPMAVLPDFQRKGVGSILVKEGLQVCTDAGYSAVVALGRPGFYLRFDFAPSINFGIESEYDVPVEVFMIKELQGNALRDCDGTVRYHELFSQL